MATFRSSVACSPIHSEIFRHVSGMQTTAGSHAFVGSITPGDADVIKNLRAKGAIILGKANLAELTGLRKECSQQWSGRGGTCFSAFVPYGDPSSSSGGNAVALSAGFAAACIASDTTGSITMPASRAACYALRPTVGLVSTEGAFPQSSTFDTLGPMAKSAYDVALLLTHMRSPLKGVAPSTSLEISATLLVQFLYRDFSSPQKTTLSTPQWVKTGSKASAWGYLER
jgi:Asp-tRNA(Asn)/Glu-tRNA(Gln) amidotransferase A subunit family amidase